MKIGIITMHRILNYGSVLQAYALQKALSKLNYESEIIDYAFPPKSKRSYWLSFKHFIYRIRFKTIFNRSKASYFKEFIHDNLKLSKNTYNTQSLKQAQFDYDIYMTGSDQVWNPRWTGIDTSFLLSFVKDSHKKIAYGASFACKTIPEKLKSTYTDLLSKYKHITVRERSGSFITKNLLGNEATVVCDPTLLLSPQDYHNLSKKSNIKIEEPYILVYNLGYMFNPYPQINDTILKIKSLLKFKVVYIGSPLEKCDDTCLSFENLGPCEFLWLFEHSEFVITSSFHGVAFATIFNKPLLAAVKKEDGDDRISSLLSFVGNHNAAFQYQQIPSYSKDQLLKLKCDIKKKELLRNQSLHILQNIINN